MVRNYSADQELAEKTGLDPALMERLKSLGYAGFSGGSDTTATDNSRPDPKIVSRSTSLFQMPSLRASTGNIGARPKN